MGRPWGGPESPPRLAVTWGIPWGLPGLHVCDMGTCNVCWLGEDLVLQRRLEVPGVTALGRRCHSQAAT